MPLFCVIGVVPTPPVFGPVTLAHIREKQCRWPVGNGLFCGCLAARGPYCSEHARRTYVGKGRPISVPSD